MPSERFYRLPEAKKESIRAAAKKEFARVPFDKTSINQIIRSADISRGSFYTYFEDKLDVLRWLMEDYSEQMKQKCSEELSSNGGDFFAMLEMLFEYFTISCPDRTEMLDISRNYFSFQENINFVSSGDIADPVKDDCENETVNWICSRIDKKKLYDDNMGVIQAMIHLGLAALLLSMKQYYEYPEHLNSIREDFKNSIILLRRGAYADP